MTHDLNHATERLAAVLARENAALAGLDLRRAAGMLAEKQQAAAAFIAAAAQPGAVAPPVAQARRLHDLAEENRRGLEHAIAVQRRIIGIIARAVRGIAATPRYGATGAMAAGRPSPVTLSARA
ncbi:MAG TPA: hypothetical protein VND19_02005 [Acetobacteraceae bacterium]|nr:hypothetical protein [Acetobacteraceae bacterium]